MGDLDKDAMTREVADVESRSFEDKLQFGSPLKQLQKQYEDQLEYRSTVSPCKGSDLISSYHSKKPERRGAL